MRAREEDSGLQEIPFGLVYRERTDEGENKPLVGEGYDVYALASYDVRRGSDCDNHFALDRLEALHVLGQHYLAAVGAETHVFYQGLAAARAVRHHYRMVYG